MAANTKICRCLSSFLNRFVFLLIICISCDINHTYAATTTTPANVTTPTTTPAATTTTTTLPPTTTTTLPPTTTLAPNQPRTSIGETAIGQCLCDLTGNECDINCCCDTDCSEADKAPFICNPRSVILDDKLCFQDQVFLFSNSPARTEKTDGGLFCIYYDNYNERNYYLDPNFIQDFTTFRDYLDKYSDPSLQQPESNPQIDYTLSSFYKAGDPISVVYPDESVGNMVLPATLGSSQCNDQNTMAYLTEASMQCTRDVTLNAQTCTTTKGLDAASFWSGFRVVKTPGLFGYVVNGTFVGLTTTPVPTTAAPVTTPADPNATTAAVTGATPTTPPLVVTTLPPNTVDPAQVQTLYDNAYTVSVDTTTRRHLCKLANGTLAACTFTNPPSPTFAAATTCQNVVLEARYFITTNGTFGIDSVQVQFVFGDATQASFPLSQSYSVTFNSVFDSAGTADRSGNPGYQIGKYLLYGELNQTANPDGTTVQTIITSSDPALGLTVVRASASGDCAASTSDRVPIKFGQNMRTGCLIRFNYTTTATACEELQKLIVETLEGPNTPEYDVATKTWTDNHRYVATFGNTLDYKVGDWVRIIVDGRTMPNMAETAAVPTGTCRLRMGQHIQVLYANVGALANPQPKIVGVAIIYDSIWDVSVRCTGAFCQTATAGQSQAFEVSQTVSFVDVSQPAVKYQGEAPVFIARVPNDFFYPFLYYTSGAPTPAAQWTLPLFVSLLVTVYSCLRFRML